MQSKLSGNFAWRYYPLQLVSSLFAGADAEGLLKEIYGRANADYQDAPILYAFAMKDSSVEGSRKVFVQFFGDNFEKNKKYQSLPEGIVTGSNFFAIVLANQILRDNNLPIRTLTSGDLGRLVESGIINLRGSYEDTALVLRTSGDSYKRNDYLARNLAEQLKHRSISFSPEKPVLIQLKDLDLEIDGNSAYGLVFKLRDEAQVIQSKKLSHQNNLNRFNKTEKNGLPIFNKKGKRIFYACRSNGLVGLGLYDGLNLISNWDDLGYSDADGRMGLVSSEAQM